LTPREDNQATPVRLPYRSQSTALIPPAEPRAPRQRACCGSGITVGDRRSGLTRAPEPRNGRRSRQAGADHEGLAAGTDFDTDLFFYTCVLHDLGTSPSAPGKQRFEAEGADIAAEFLTGHAYGVRETDPVWERR
jgi:hypothetical protein